MPQNKLKRDDHLDGEDQLPGLPGYRTRDGRSGYDPLDTNRETAFMEGTFFRSLFTLRLRTRNAFYLILMFASGAVLSVFLSLILFGMISAPRNGEMNLGGYLAFAVIILLWGFFLAAGLALLVNFSLNMRAILGIGKNRAERDSKMGRPRKKLPRRRKDFR